MTILEQDINRALYFDENRVIPHPFMAWLMRRMRAPYWRVHFILLDTAYVAAPIVVCVFLFILGALSR